MRKLALNFAGIFALSALLFSCAEPDSDMIADGHLTVNYAVQVVPVGDVDKGLEGASVTIQGNGETRTASVGADGIAVFNDVRPGTISGFVTATDYADLNFSATIMKTNIDANTEDYVTSTVYMIATNSTIEGRIYGDYDFDGTAPLNDNSSFTAVDVYVTYSIGANYPLGAGNGALNSVSIDTYTYGVTTGTNGVFSLATLPTTDKGYLTASYWMADWSQVDPATDMTMVYNIGTNTVSLNPGVITNVGDVAAN